MSWRSTALLAVLCLSGGELGCHREMLRDRAESVLRTDLRTMRDCISQYRGDRGVCPASLEELVNAGYLYKLPVDPITKSASTWVVIFGGAADAETCREGVIDVRSGSERLALDGTPYSSW